MNQFQTWTFILFAMVFPSSITASASSHDIFGRQSTTCKDTTFTQCDGVPSGFCCSPSTTCSVLADNTTLLCCPNGKDCSVIQPISCDISLQNIALHPTTGLYTTNLTATLTGCGSGGCCPFGYSCRSEDTTCIVDANQGSSPSHTSSPSSTSTPTAVQIGTSTSATPTAPAITTNPCAVQQSCNAFPAGAILAGFFPGLFAGGLLACAFFCLLGAYRRKQARLSGSSFSFGKVSASISDPIYQEGSAIRTDFIRKTSAPSSPARYPTIQRVRSLFRKSAAASGTEIAMISPSEPPPPPLVQATAPQTPRLQREPSGESINIFADPSTAMEGRKRRESHQTTFTDMMERADLAAVRNGEPFVQKLSPKTYHSPPRGVPRNT